MKAISLYAKVSPPSKRPNQLDITRLHWDRAGYQSFRGVAELHQAHPSLYSLDALIATSPIKHPELTLHLSWFVGLRWKAKDIMGHDQASNHEH